MCFWRATLRLRKWAGCRLQLFTPLISEAIAPLTCRSSHSYTKADNSVIVATDSIKNTIYITAKQQPVTPPELFGSILGTHFIEKYAHIHAAHVNIITHRWVRMNIDGKEHPHSFVKDGAETRNVQVDVVEGKGIDINSAINGLTVLKSTNSQFWGFIRDEYTTLKETWDRILSTDVAANWQWRRFNGLSEVKTHADKFNAAWELARKITLKTFAEDNSASVQNTMYKMGEQILAGVPLIETVEYSLPNNHYFEIGMSLYWDFFRLDSNTSQTSTGTRAPRTPARTPRCTRHSPTPMVSSSARWAAPARRPSCRCLHSGRLWSFSKARFLYINLSIYTLWEWRHHPNSMDKQILSHLQLLGGIVTCRRELPTGSRWKQK